MAPAPSRKTISTIAILWPVKAIFKKRAATVEVDTFISPCYVGCDANVVTPLFAYSLIPPV